MSTLPYQLGCSTLTERSLRRYGEIRVRPGELVEPDTIIGVEQVPGEPVVVDVAAGLGLPPSEAGQHLTVQVGEHVGRGQAVAQYSDGRRSYECRSPEEGILASYDDMSGLTTILPVAHPMELRAHVAGVVRAVVPGRSVTIETVGARITGVWGVGGELHGVIRLATGNPREPVGLAQLDSRLTYSLLVVGGSVTADVLAHCATLGVRAVIAAGIAPAELARYVGARDGSLDLRSVLTRPLEPARRDFAPIPMMLTEGFGEHVMSDVAWETLVACSGRVGSISAAGWPAKPRLVVQLPKREFAEVSAPEPALLAPGARVTIGGMPGDVSATVLRHPADPVGLPSRVVVEGALVRTDDGQARLMPAMNLRVVRNPPRRAEVADADAGAR